MPLIVEEQVIPEDVELNTKIDVAKRMLLFGDIPAKSKKRVEELLAGYKKQLAKLEKKSVKKDA